MKSEIHVSDSAFPVRITLFQDYANGLDIGYTEEIIEENVVAIQLNRAFATLIKNDGSMICYPTNKVFTMEPLVNRKSILWPSPLKEVGD